jgi:hypothetical protein
MLPSQFVKQTPVIGSVYGFYRTARKVYDAATPAGAIKQAVKGIVIDCTPPHIKYPILCASLATTGLACVITGFNPLAFCKYGKINC